MINSLSIKNKHKTNKLTFSSGQWWSLGGNSGGRCCSIFKKKTKQKKEKKESKLKKKEREREMGFFFKCQKCWLFLLTHWSPGNFLGAVCTRSGGGCCRRCSGGGGGFFLVTFGFLREVVVVLRVVEVVVSFCAVVYQNI